MKRCLIWILAVLICSGLVGEVCPFAGAVEVTAKSALVMDGDSGRVLYEKNADARSLIASTTKIMTALVVCEECNVLDRVRIMPEAVGIEGSSMYLQPGEVLTVQELLYGLMLHSGNDAAVALAIYCGGTLEGFVQLMNDYAHRLGLKNTNFENPNGLDSEHHYSTARDLAVLTCAAMKNPIFAKTVSTKTVKVGQRYLTNHNKLLWRYEGADGVKTGYTKAAGRILVSSAVRQGRRLVAVTINAPNDWQDHKKLLDHGFDGYTMKELLRKGEKVGNLPVLSGTAGEVSLIAAQGFSWPLADGEKVTIELGLGDFEFAPVTAGEIAGYAHILVEGIPVGKIPVYWGETVDLVRQPKKRSWFLP